MTTVRFDTDKKPIFAKHKFILSLKWFICAVHINQKNTTREGYVLYINTLLLTERAADITISVYIYIIFACRFFSDL